MTEDLEYCKSWFPQDLLELLTFENEGKYVTIRFKHFVSKETFGKTAAIVRQHNGEYVSQGKLSHFKVLPETQQESRMDREQLVKDALAYAKHCVENLEKAGY